MELTKTVKDKIFDDYFTVVDHSESISEDRPGSMRLFYLNVRSGKIKIADFEKFTMLNIDRYVFSRLKQEQYEKAGNLDAVMQQALRIMRKRGTADSKGTGNELGEIMIYAFLEEKLKAYKLLSKIELSTDAARAEVVFCRGNKQENKDAFDSLYTHKAKIESALGTTLQWNRSDDIKSSKVFIKLNNVSIENETDWLQMANFHADWTKKFYDVIVPYIQQAE